MIAEGEGPAGGIQVDAAFRVGQQDLVGAVAIVRDLAIADGAVIGLQGGQVGVELVGPLQQLAGIGAVLGDDELVAAIVQEGGIGLDVAVAVRALDGLDDHVVHGVAQQLSVGGPAEHDAGGGARLVLNLRANHVAGLGEALGIEGAVHIQLMRPFHGGLVVLGGGHEIGLVVRVHAHVVAGAAGLHAEGQQQTVQIALKRSGRDEAVAALAGFRESYQHVRQLGVGGGYVQTQLVQPNLVDVHLVGGGGAHGQLLGQRINLAIGVGAQRLHGGILLEDRRQVGHVLRDQVGQLHEEVLVQRDIAVGQADGAEEGVRQRG